MNGIARIDHVFDCNRALGCPTLHPLVSVIDFSQCPVTEHIRFCLGFYAVFLKDVRCGDMLYGLPTVHYCAQQMHLSANYFGDLIKRLTGKTAQEHIRLRLVDLAKERIADPAVSIAQVAYDLGFKYPAHFSRLFRNTVGCSPNHYRKIN